MNFLIIVMIILSLFGLLSLFFTRNVFHMIEIIAYFMVITILIEQVFTMISLNLEMIQLTEKIPRFWSHCLYRFIVIPCITIWLFYSYFSPASPLVLKIVLTGVWLFGMFGLEVLGNRLGLITFIRWNIGYSLIEFLVVLVGSVCYAQWFRSLLRKQACI